MSVLRPTRRKAGRHATPQLPDDVSLIYAWLHHTASSLAVAEDLTIEVLARLRSDQPVWLIDRADDIRRRFFVAQVLLEQRGVLPPRSAGTPSAQ